MKIFDLTFDGIYMARQESYDCDFIVVLFEDGNKVVEHILTMKDWYSVLDWPEYNPGVCAIRGANKKEIRRFLAYEEELKRIFFSGNKRGGF